MPRPSKGARLYLRPPKRDKASGAVISPSRWVIRDGGRDISTGCGPEDHREAERKLAEYLAEKHAPERRERPLSEIPVADVISLYCRDVAPGQVRPGKAIERAERLLSFFGDKRLDEVNGSLCRAYAALREGQGRSNKGTGGGARRDLQDLAAAINHHHREGLHRAVVKVTLPPRGEARQRWLSRHEVARLIWACLTTREAQNGAETRRRPLAHLARFVLIGVYTGTRPGAILAANWDRAPGRGWVDLERGLFYRRPDGAVETTKRQTPVPLPTPLWRLMRRWARQDGHIGPVVRFAGLPIASVKTAMKRAVALAGLDDSVTGYTMRHTTASWGVIKGVPTRKIAELLGTSEAMIEKHYGHLNPDHLREEADWIARK